MDGQVLAYVGSKPNYGRASVTESPFPLKGQDWLKAKPQVQEQLLDLAFRFWRRRGFPYYELSPAEIKSEYQKLRDFDSAKLFCRNNLRGPSLGLSLANYFHPAMWSVRVSRYRSPMDVFEDDDLLRSAIRRALRIWPTRYSANASCLRRMLKTFPGTASVSNFKPLIAKAIIEKYSSNGAVVLDFCAGYGGRLLGCMTLSRSYVGVEPCRNQVAGLHKMIRSVSSFKPRDCVAKILEGCAEDVLKELPPRSAELIFSSPPYFDWEKYAHHRTQSFIRYRSYSQWVEEFLQPVIAESARILKDRGHLVLNVSRRRSPSPEEVTAIGRRHGLEILRSHRLLMPKVPYLHPRNGCSQKSEHLLVFAKAGR